MKRIPLIISVFAFLLSCGGDEVYRIESKLSNLEDQLVYAVFESEDRSVIDTITCHEPGQFRIERGKEGFNQVTFLFENKTLWFTVYLVDAGGKIVVAGDMKYPTLLQAKGGRLNNELSSVCKILTPLLKEREDLLNIQKSNPIDPNDITSRLTNVNYQLCERALAYIHDHPEEAASVVLMKTYLLDPDDTRRLDELLIILDPKLKDFYLVKELEQYSERAKRTSLGAEAPNFTVKNIYGELVSLDSFPQKYLLLTFTAPWCDMCRTDDLYLDEIDRKYNEDQLEQLLVSLDDDMQALKELLKKDSIQWNLVADSAGQASMLLNLYNVSALPRCFLIDEEGKIILKTDNGIEIKQTLDNLIKN
ncbi:MAG: TlpA family protein disulfide reductase [Tannerellaceae bacterium]|jgi:peroxiredoxin|nr:TlpA family protein disulfide reductase [Tannerellaceae bacterium]